MLAITALNALCALSHALLGRIYEKSEEKKMFPECADNPEH